MKKLMVGLFAVAAAMGVYGADQISWFTENATTVAAALEVQGKSTDGTWTSTDGLSVADARIEVDADEETPVAYAPDAQLKGDAATLTFADITFGAAYAADQLPALSANAQVGVALKETEGGAVFAVVENGVWKATEVAADPEASYTIVCEVSYADQTVTYSCGATKIATIQNTATDPISKLNIGGSGSLASLTATRAPEPEPAKATVKDTVPPTIDDVTFDVAKTFTSGDPAEKAGAFEGWNADFVVTVDKDVEAGAIALAGNLGDWAGFPMGALKAGEPFMLLKSILGEDVPYGMVVGMQTFPCALANLDVTNDTTITVTLIAMKGSVTNELASFDYEIKAKPAKATVKDTEPPTIEVPDHEPVTFDVAKTFVSGNPVEKAEDFEDWTADFAVTVDKDVEAGAILLAGALDSMWVPLEMGALKAGEEFLLLRDGVQFEMPYGGVVAMQEFPCALANLDVTNDTTITVTLIAMKGTETRELASFNYEIKAKPVGPKSDEGTIEPADPKTGIAEFTPTDSTVTEATIDLGDFTGKIAIPSTIETLKGVPAERIYVRNAKGTVIDAAAFVGGDEKGYSTALTPAAQNPAFGATEDGETKESPFVISDGDVALGVKTLAGLTYQLMKATTLGASAEWTNVGDPVEGDGNAMALRAEKAAQDPAAFYKVDVGK